MASVWVNVSLELAGIGECFGNSSGNASSGTTSSKAVTTAVDGVLATGQDKSRASVRRRCGSTISESENLSESDGLLGHLSVDSGANVEVARIEEGKDIARQLVLS